MTEVYRTEDVKKLLHNKFVLIIGDSIQRTVYKDLIRLLQDDHYLTPAQLKAKGKESILGDKLMDGGVFGQLHNGKDYREVRQFLTDVHLVRYYYITRCYGEYMETIFEDIGMEDQPSPDVVIMSSCVWDITRYGPNGLDMYKRRLQDLCHRLHEVLPEDTLFIWSGSLPVGKDVKGGFMLSEIAFINEVLRSDVVEANFFASQVIRDHGFDMIDFHFYFRHQIQHRLNDGIHWDEIAHRRISNMLLTHIAEAWHQELPSMYRNPMVQTEMDRIQSVMDYGAPGYDECYDMDDEERYGGPIRIPSWSMAHPASMEDNQKNFMHGASQRNFVPRWRQNRPAKRYRSLSCQPLIQQHSNHLLLYQNSSQMPMDDFVGQEQIHVDNRLWNIANGPDFQGNPESFNELEFSTADPQELMVRLQRGLQAFTNNPFECFENYINENYIPDQRPMHAIHNNVLHRRRNFINPY